MNAESQTSEDFIDYVCPNCGRIISFSSICVGTLRVCPFCSEPIIIPRTDHERARCLPLPIKTLRLIVRCLKSDDLQDWLEFSQVEHSYKFEDHVMPTEEEARSWFARLTSFQLTVPKGYLAFGIELQDSSKLIGHLFLYLKDPEDYRQASLRVLIHEDYRGRGYATEATIAICNFGFNEIGLHDIRARADQRDISASRMLEKAGMKLEGEFIEEYQAFGKWISSRYYVVYSSSMS